MAKRRKADPRDVAMSIVRRLHAEGYTALFAGGCVRDMLLGRPPTDFDVATDAKPNEVLALYPRARTVGAQFGVVLVRRHGCDVEVATFRADGVYSDGRHPDSISFGTAREDALRRDFTINAMFFDPLQDQVIDHVEGRRDLEAGVIRTVGPAEARFGEDHLRMLRAVRFSARLGFPIEPETWNAIETHAPRLSGISAERIWMELEKILLEPGRSREGWQMICDSGLVDFLVPHGTPYLRAPGVAVRLGVMDETDVRKGPALALSVLLARQDESDVLATCRALKLSNKLTDAVRFLVRESLTLLGDQPPELADLKEWMASACWPDLPQLYRIILVSENRSIEPADTLCARAERVDPSQIEPPPLLTGERLMQLGIEPGPIFGRVMKAVYRAQLNEDIATVDDAEDLARKVASSASC